ncbi:MAG: hypothetical protein ABI866_06075 [Dokdonella sp.]
MTCSVRRAAILLDALPGSDGRGSATGSSNNKSGGGTKFLETEGL